MMRVVFFSIAFLLALRTGKAEDQVPHARNGSGVAISPVKNLPHPGQALVEAAENGQQNEVRRILEQHPEVVNTLSPEMKAGDPWSALHWAIARDDSTMVEVLLANKADANIRPEFGPRPLELAESAGVARKLLAAGAKVNGVGLFGETPLHVARSAEIADLLLEHGAKLTATSPFLTTPLHSAVDDNRMAVAQTLIARNADVNATDFVRRTPLHSACENGNLFLVRLLIEHGADVQSKDKHDVTPIRLAARGHRGVSSEDSSRTEIIRLLRDRKASINETNDYGLTLLHEAAANGHVEVARYLVDSGLQINATDKNHRTPLHYAAELASGPWGFRSDGAREIALVEFLLARGANVNSRSKVNNDYDGNNDERVTPLALATIDRKTNPLSEGSFPQCPDVESARKLQQNRETWTHTRGKIAEILRKYRTL
jgi:ankyrin repeat protein